MAKGQASFGSGWLLYIPYTKRIAGNLGASTPNKNTSKYLDDMDGSVDDVAYLVSLMALLAKRKIAYKLKN